MEDPRFPLVSPAMALAANGSSPRVRSGSWSGELRTKPHPIFSQVSSLIRLTAGRRRRDGGGNPLQRVRSRSCRCRWCKLVQDLPRLSRASREGLCVLRARSQQLTWWVAGSLQTKQGGAQGFTPSAAQRAPRVQLEQSSRATALWPSGDALLPPRSGHIPPLTSHLPSHEAETPEQTWRRLAAF